MYSVKLTVYEAACQRMGGASIFLSFPFLLVFPDAFICLRLSEATRLSHCEQETFAEVLV